MQTRALIFVCGLVSTSCLALPAGGVEPGASLVPNTAVPHRLSAAELDTVTVRQGASGLTLGGFADGLAVLNDAIREIEDFTGEISEIIPPVSEARPQIISQLPEPHPEKEDVGQHKVIIPSIGTTKSDTLDRAQKSAALAVAIVITKSRTQLTGRFNDEIDNPLHLLEGNFGRKERRFAKSVGPTFLATASVLKDHPHLAERFPDRVGNLREFLREAGLSNKEAKQLVKAAPALATALAKVENRFHLGATVLEQHPRLEKRLTNRLKNLTWTRIKRP
jgi:hypothetical protein